MIALVVSDKSELGSISTNQLCYVNVGCNQIKEASGVPALFNASLSLIL
jgi:hypothetical protein